MLMVVPMVVTVVAMVVIKNMTTRFLKPYT